MPDLNKTMSELVSGTKSTENNLRDLLLKYDDFHREANSMFMDERSKTGSIDGLEEFYRLIQIVKRNRDVIGSLLRGIHGIRPMDRFRFIEQDIETEIKNSTPKKKGRKRKENTMPPPIEAPEMTEGVING